MPGLLEAMAKMLARARGAGQDVLDQRSEARRTQALRPLLAKFGPDTAAEIGPAATSADPDMRATGLQQLSGLLGQLDPKYQADLQDKAQQLEAGDLALRSSRFSNLLAARTEQRTAAQFPLQQRTARQGLAIQQQQMELNRLALIAAQPQPVSPLGEVPTGMTPAKAPNGELQYIPQPWSNEYATAQEATREAEDTLKDVTRFQSLVEQVGPSGSEGTGPQATTLKFLRGNVIARVAKLRNLGVLQPGELENIEEQLPDPTSWSRNVSGFFGAIDPSGKLFDYQRQTIQAPYTAMRELLEQRVRQGRKQYWYVTHGNVLPEDAAPQGGW